MKHYCALLKKSVPFKLFNNFRKSNLEKKEYSRFSSDHIIFQILQEK